MPSIFILMLACPSAALRFQQDPSRDAKLHSKDIFDYESKLYNKKMLQYMTQMETEDIQTKPDLKIDSNCQLPEGAKWCSGRINNKQRIVAAYSGPDPVSKGICASGHWELSAVSELKGLEVKRKNKTFLDVGANTGWWSSIFSDAGYKVFSV